jgi:cell division transport system ATP-binding protein
MIRFDGVSKQYRSGNRPALHDATLEVKPGEFVFLVGASGSGKSSFLRLILREERASSGQIHVLGQDLGRLSNRKVPHYRRNLGVVFQDFRLLPTKTVFDNVAFALRVLGKSEAFIHDAVPEVLGLVGLGNKENRLPHELSGGEQQRVAIARAVVNKPAILLADEPTGNLDPTTSKGIMDVLRNINAAGTTVLMATHDTAIVNLMQKRVVELSDGRIIRDEASGSYVTTAHDIIVLDESALQRADSQPIALEPLDFDPIPDFDPMSPTSEALDLSYLDRMRDEDPL